MLSYIHSQTSQGLNEVHFLWQGGEPTLCGLDFYEKIIQLQKKYMPKDKDVKIYNALQTNGILLTEDWASFLAKNQFLVGLSLDGTKEMHDTFRVDKRKQGFYELVVAALKRLQDAQVEVNILSVINSTPKSYTSIWLALVSHKCNLFLE